MRLSVALLGSPRIERGETDYRPPKGNKAWGLLAYLLLSPGPHTRSRLAELLFANADDPLGALRWNLAQLRSALGLGESLRGNEITLALPPASVLDVDVLTRGTWTEAVRLRGLGCDLLDGIGFGSDPHFETWLMLERARVRNIAQSVLREAAAASLGTGRPTMAADFASRALGLDPFDETSHEMLIRGLAGGGLHDKAADAFERCTALFREELGCEPSPALKQALSERSGTIRPAVAGVHAARAQLELGRSAIKAGATDTGVENLRIAVGAAEEAEDQSLLAESLLALAYALAHAIRGRDGEASSLLHRALDLATKNGMTPIAAECLRELGYVEMLVGSYERALASLARALEMGQDDHGQAWTLAYQAICYSDTGRYEQATACLEKCTSLADAATSQMAYALCLLGRIQMLRGELTDARATLERSIAMASACGWTVLLPWPQALLAEVDLLSGTAADEVRDRLEQALSLAQQIGDPCWEAAALHGLGLVEAQTGSVAGAAQHLEQASTVCSRYPDTYIWMKAYNLDALCDLATRAADPASGRWISDLQHLAARTGMSELLARSYLYRARSGDPGAAATARLLVRQVDNPALADLL